MRRQEPSVTKGKIEAALKRLDKLGSGEDAEGTGAAQGSARYAGPPTSVTSNTPYLVLR